MTDEERGRNMEHKEENGMQEMDQEQLETVAAGNCLEAGGIAGWDAYRAGITCDINFFTGDKYSIGGTQISKDKAILLKQESKALWSSKYAEAGDLVGFIREWRGILSSKYGIQWNGQIGTMHRGW